MTETLHIKHTYKANKHLNEAIKADPKVKGQVFTVLGWFLINDWGNVPAETAKNNDTVLATKAGNIHASYILGNVGFAVDATYLFDMMNPNECTEEITITQFYIH